MKFINLLNISALVICILCAGCYEKDPTVKSTYKYIQPIYNNIKLIPQEDTLHFSLTENTYNDVKSFNYFINNGVAFISFHDNRSHTVNIYDFNTRQRIKKIKLKKWFKDPLYKNSVYVRNFDSIFITNQSNLYLFDSAGRVKKSIAFNDKKYALFENSKPISIQGHKLLMGIRPYVSETSFSELKQWRMLYGFDLQHNTKQLSYSWPEIYRHNLYGYSFLDYSYCYNSKGNIVFSFPADTNIYETNLSDHHVAYYGKSRFQSGDISPVPEEAIRNDKAYHEFKLRDSYGYIYYDPFRKRYLRLARQKNSETEIQAKSGIKRQSVIIFDDNFRIIAEPSIPGDFSISSLFFTRDGIMFTRVNSKDEYALHYVRLAYVEDSGVNNQLTKK